MTEFKFNADNKLIKGATFESVSSKTNKSNINIDKQMERYVQINGKVFYKVVNNTYNSENEPFLHNHIMHSTDASNNQIHIRTVVPSSTIGGIPCEVVSKHGEVDNIDVGAEVDDTMFINFTFNNETNVNTAVLVLCPGNTELMLKSKAWHTGNKNDEFENYDQLLRLAVSYSNNGIGKLYNDENNSILYAVEVGSSTITQTVRKVDQKVIDSKCIVILPQELISWMEQGNVYGINMTKYKHFSIGYPNNKNKFNTVLTSESKHIAMTIKDGVLRILPYFG